MDDDARVYKTMIKGTAYSFAPFADDDIAMMAELTYMGASGRAYVRGAMKALQDASDPEQWGLLSDRLVAREVRLDDLANAFSKLFERQLKERADTKPADAQ